MEAEPEADGLALLWEKRFQQSIVVDLSDDESLHFSDLDSCVSLRLSRAESPVSGRSVHLSGSAELSALEDSSESSSVGSRSEKDQVNKANGSVFHVSARRPNTMRDEPPRDLASEDGGGNTSEEDQEELPYDGTPGSSSFNHTASSEDTVSSEGRCTLQGSPNPPAGQDLMQKKVNAEKDAAAETSKAGEAAPRSPADIHQVLLRHFSQDELLRSGWLIETETLPEVSLLDSVDETVLSSAKTHCGDASCTAASNAGSEEDIQPCITSGPAGPDSVQSPEETRVEEVKQLQRAPLLRTASFSEIKYGQGQVHYPLPDFSKVQSKVKIPRAPSGPVRPAPQSFILRAQSSPGMLEVISRVLEDSSEPPEKPYVFKDTDSQTPPALVQHLQAEYDKLLTRYAEAENIIDQMRIESNALPLSGLEHHGAQGAELVQESRLRRPAPPENLFHREAPAAPSSKTETSARCSHDGDDNHPSDGEQMTSDLRDIVSQFMQNVENFKCSVSNMTINTTDQQMILRSMMEAQDQLERNYISRKEEHRALEMQRHMGLCRNTGTFDPNRLVEGDIFRIGMHLDEIKERIDGNVCEQISLRHSSSTPQAVTAQGECSPLCLEPASPAPPLCQGSVSQFSIASLREEEEQDLKDQEDGESNQSTEILCADAPPRAPGLKRCHSWGSHSVLESRGVQSAEDEDNDEEERSSVWTEAIDHSDIIAYLRAKGPREQRRTANSGHSTDGVLNPGAGCGLGACEVSFSLDHHSVSAPPLNTSCVSQEQRIVSPETDSGFGSSYLNQSSSGLFHPHLLRERDELQVSSDSDASDLQTEIQPAAPTPHRGAASAVERWVESTTMESSVRRRGSELQLKASSHPPISQPVHGSTMETEERDRTLHSCPCNRKDILALQAEVTRLKKDLEEGLVQLPHLAQKMDYLTSKYRQERNGRRSKTRLPQEPAPDSIGKSTSNLRSCKMRIEDWISTDMDPSRNTGTEGSDTSCSEQLHSSPVGGRRSSRAELHSELQSTRAIMRGFVCEDRCSLICAPPPQKPLLQVTYGSSCSLPASYKLQEPLQPVPHRRKCSTQSDTALLPSNVYFQRTWAPLSAASRNQSRTGRRRGSQEEDLNRTLDRAIEVARSMKRTTDRMARRLSADLARAQSHRRLHSTDTRGQQPAGL